MNGFINTLLRLNGVPQATIDEIVAASPAAGELLKMVKDNEALIVKVGTLYAEAQPLIQKAMPLLQQAWADVEKILPAAQDALAFVNAKPVEVQTPSGYDPGAQI